MTIIFEQTKNITECFKVGELITTLDIYYPNINDWFLNKAMPDVISGSGILMLAKEKDNIVGFALGKKPGPSHDIRDTLHTETKLRCIRIKKEFQNTGLGVRLLDNILNELETITPHCTVSEEMLHQYSRIFVNRYGFKLNSVNKGMYRKNKLEYIFN